MLWFYLFNNFILIVLFAWYNRKLFIQEPSKPYNFLLVTVIIVVKSVLNLHTSSQINLFMTLFTYFLISSLFFKGTIIKKIVFIGFFLITSFISEICAYIFLTPLLNQYAVQSNSFVYLFVGNVLSRLILILLVYIIAKMNVIKDLVDNKGLWYFITFPVISVTIIYFIVNSNLLEIDPTLCILISFGIILFNIIICVGFVDIIKSKNFQIENEKLKSQKLHYLLLEEKIDDTKRFIHDFKKHVNIMNGYVKCQDYDKLKDYLKELAVEFKNNEAFVITGNKLIDLSLNANKKILIDHSIDVKYDVKLKNTYPISDLDFNIVFSNILDNAIESCINTKGHFIKIKLDKNNDLIILKIINPCFHVNKNYETMKKNDEYHGYGIKNIKKVVQKYSGMANFDFDKENNVFVSTVIFSINNE